MRTQTDRLDQFLDRMVAVLGHKDRHGPRRDYCLGLLLDGDRKSMEPMAARLAPATTGARHQQLQDFVTHSRWDDEAILKVVREWVLPELTQAGPVQTCIVHLIRYSMQLASWKERKAIAAGLKPVHRAPDPDAARAALDTFDEGPRGREIPGDRAELAAQLGARYPVLRVLAGHPSGDLHDQRDREPQPRSAQGDPQQGSLSERRSGDQADLAGAAEHLGEVEKPADLLACCRSTAGHPVRRAVRTRQLINQPARTRNS